MKTNDTLILYKLIEGTVWSHLLMVTLFAWMAHKLQSSNRCTRKSSVDCSTEKQKNMISWHSCLKGDCLKTLTLVPLMAYLT